MLDDFQKSVNIIFCPEGFFTGQVAGKCEVYELFPRITASVGFARQLNND